MKKKEVKKTLFPQTKLKRVYNWAPVRKRKASSLETSPLQQLEVFTQEDHGLFDEIRLDGERDSTTPVSGKTEAGLGKEKGGDDEEEEAASWQEKLFGNRPQYPSIWPITSRSQSPPAPPARPGKVIPPLPTQPREQLKSVNIIQHRSMASASKQSKPSPPESAKKPQPVCQERDG